VPKVLETNGEVSKDGKTVTWSAPVASAYKAKQSFYLVFKAERPWYGFILDLIDAIKKFFGSLFGGADKAAAPATKPATKPASNTAAPSAPAPAPASAPAAPAPAQAQTPAEAAPAAVETGPITPRCA
jgi:hypothetical protein